MIVGALVLTLCAAGLTVYLLRTPPAVWTEAQLILDQTTPEERAQIAAEVTERLAELIEADLTEPAPEEAHSSEGSATIQRVDYAPAEQHIDRTIELTLTNRELVSVVSDEFSQWAVQRGYEVPEAIGEPVVMADDGKLVIAFAVTIDDWHQVFSGELDLAFSPDGMSQGRVDQLTAGSLPVSVKRVGEMIQQQLPDSQADTADRIGDWLSELEGFAFRPVLELEHRRRARVMGMRVGDDSLTLTLRVQDHPTYRRHNELLGIGEVAVTDVLEPPTLPGVPGPTVPDAGQFADVPTTTD